MIFHLKFFTIDFFTFVVENYTITRCDGSYKMGRQVFVNFEQMNQPCACSLKASYSGILLVTAHSAGYYECRNQVTVSFDSNTIAFSCTGEYPSATQYNVVNNESVVNVNATYTDMSTSLDLPICLQINQIGTVYVFIYWIFYFRVSFGIKLT